MGIRDFVRGGYLNMREGTVVLRHGQPFFTAIPHNASLSRETPVELPGTPQNRTEPHRTGQKRTP
jgi:hypothetical protein